jgi:hypothetical protein
MIRGRRRAADRLGSSRRESPLIARRPSACSSPSAREGRNHPNNGRSPRSRAHDSRAYDSGLTVATRTSSEWRPAVAQAASCGDELTLRWGCLCPRLQAAPLQPVPIPTCSVSTTRTRRRPAFPDWESSRSTRSPCCRPPRAQSPSRGFHARHCRCGEAPA